MKQNKLKKLILRPIFSLLSFGSILSTPFYSGSFKTSYLSSNIKINKFEFRDQLMFSNSFGTGNTNELRYIDNKFELKILLNLDMETEDENIITRFNNDFITKINKKNLKYLSTIKSSTMPTVWLYFENEKDRQILLNHIKNWKEVFKLIIYKNEYASYRVNNDMYEWILNPTPNEKQYMRKYIQNQNNVEKYIASVEKNLDIVNSLGYDRVTSHDSKIGIMEIYHHDFDYTYEGFFGENLYLKESQARVIHNGPKGHSTTVSLIAGGKHGVDKTSKIYLSTFSTDGEWNEYLEKMVKIDGVKIINHSYSFKTPDYNENSYFLDYLARKYGVIHVMAVGNIDLDKEKESKKILAIGDNLLALNSVLVGSLKENASKNTLKTNQIATYSNYRLKQEYDDLAKPLVVAPAEFYEIAYDKNGYGVGTSYSSPLVAGLISNLLKANPKINNSEFRVPLVKVILSASAITPKLSGLSYKNNGYEKKYGAGTVDFKGMLQAANNYYVAKVDPTNRNRNVLTSNPITLQKGQNIKISSSWTFNVGLLKTKEEKPKYIPNTN